MSHNTIKYDELLHVLNPLKYTNLNDDKKIYILPTNINDKKIFLKKLRIEPTRIEFLLDNCFLLKVYGKSYTPPIKNKNLINEFDLNRDTKSENNHYFLRYFENSPDKLYIKNYYYNEEYNKIYYPFYENKMIINHKELKKQYNRKKILNYL